MKYREDPTLTGPRAPVKKATVPELDDKLQLGAVPEESTKADTLVTTSLLPAGTMAKSLLQNVEPTVQLKSSLSWKGLRPGSSTFCTSAARTCAIRGSL